MSDQLKKNDTSTGCVEPCDKPRADEKGSEVHERKTLSRATQFG